MERVLRTEELEPKHRRPVRPSLPFIEWSGRRRTTRSTRVRFSIFAACADAGVIIVLAGFVGFLYQGFIYHQTGATQEAAAFGTIIACLYVAFNISRQEYAVTNYLTLTGHMRRVLMAWNMTFVTALVFVFALKATSQFSRVSVVLFYGFGLCGLITARAAIVLRVRAQAYGGKISTLRAVLVGSESELRAFAARYQPWTFGIDVIASAVLRGPETLDDDLALAAASARVLRPDDIFILAPWSETAMIDACVAAFMNVPAAIHLGPQDVLDRFSKANVSRIGTIASLNLVRQPLTTTEVVKKRLFDLVIAGVGLVVLLPFFALIALAIKCDSRGPVFFIQRRYGFNQETFRIVKFRSMSVAEDDRNLTQATRNDPRVTRVGRFMRRYNIDELPQLLNVLRGDMSLVGPRPHALVHNQHYERTIADYARRHNVKPGLTGWAQVNGLRGEVVSDVAMRSRVEHDLLYIENWSLGLDLRIIGMTLLTAQAFENAF